MTDTILGFISLPTTGKQSRRITDINTGTRTVSSPPKKTSSQHTLSPSEIRTGTGFNRETGKTETYFKFYKTHHFTLQIKNKKIIFHITKKRHSPHNTLLR